MGGRQGRGFLFKTSDRSLSGVAAGCGDARGGPDGRARGVRKALPPAPVETVTCA